MMNEIWKELIHERNARETEPFVDIYESYDALLHLVDNLQAKCEEQETHLLELTTESMHADGLSLDLQQQHDDETAAASANEQRNTSGADDPSTTGESTTVDGDGGGALDVTSMVSNSTTGGVLGSKIVRSSYNKSLVQSKRESQLRDKVERLQEQLNTKLKIENDSTKLQLKQATELSELKDKVASQDQTIAQLKNDNREANETIESLLTRLKETESSLHITTEQNGQLKESINQIRNENEELSKVNGDLLGRFVSEKEGMMDQFNKMNSLLEHQQHEIDMLRTFKQQQEDQVSRLAQHSPNRVGGGGEGGGSSGADNNKQPKKSLAMLAKEDSQREAALLAGLKGLSSAAFLDRSVQPPSTPKHVFHKCHKGEIVGVRYDSQGTGNVGGNENDLLTTAGSDGIVKVWNASKGTLVTTLRASGAGQPLLCVDISGELVVAGSSDKSCRIWSLKTGRMIHHLVGHGSKVTCVRLMSDQHKSVISGSGDRTMKLWDISRGTYRQTSTLRHGSTVYCMDLHLNASTIVSGHLDGGLRLWDIRSPTDSSTRNILGGISSSDVCKQTMEIPNLHTGGITSVQFHPLDSTKLFTFGRDATLKVIDIRMTGASASTAASISSTSATSEETSTGGEGPEQQQMIVQQFSHPKLTVGNSFTASASLSPDGAFCAVGSAGGGSSGTSSMLSTASSSHKHKKQPPTIFVWRLSDGKLLQELTKPHTSSIQGVAWGSGGVVGGPQVASIDKGGDLVLWS